MILIVGLGNPDEEFFKTRHNIGFSIVDKIKDKWDFPEYKSKFSGKISEKKINDEKIILLKPMTYMNLSGNSVQSICNFMKIETQNILIIHDDVDMKLGKIRIKSQGGHGGHNGIRHIIHHIGDKFNRLKIGIQPEKGIVDTKKFVLQKFKLNEEKEINMISKNIIDSFSLIFKRDFIQFVNKVMSNNGV